MADIKLNTSHDISWDDVRLTEDNGESVAQRIKIRLLRYQGEWFKDTTKGIPYFQELMKKGIAKDYIDTVMIDEILDTAGVVSLDAYESEMTISNVYVASFVATTSNGITFQFNISPIDLA